MRRKCGIMKIVVGSATGAIVAVALGLTHHVFSARLVGDELITVKGYVTKIEWTSPHAYMYLDVEAEDGQWSSWAFEMGAPPVLQRRGWTPRSVEIGDEVEVEGFLARSESPLVNTSSVQILRTGQRLEAAVTE